MKKLTMLAVILLMFSAGVRADYQAGLEYFKMGKYKEALGEFEMDMEIYGSYWYFPAYMAAVCYFKMNDYESALSRLREAETATAQSQTKALDLAKIKTLEAQIMVAEKKYANAISIADKYIPQSPAEAQAQLYYIKGFAENKSAQHSKAVNDLIQAIALDDSKDDYHYQLGLAYVKNGNFDSAIKALEKAASLNPRNKPALELLTDVCLNRAREVSGSTKERLYDKTVQWCQKGLKAFPNDKDLLMNLGNAHLGSKEYATAITVFENLRNRYGNEKEIVFGLGSAYLGNKQFADALPHLERVKSRMDNSPLIYTYIGTAELALVKDMSNDQGKLQQTEKAIDTLSEGRRKFSSSSAIRNKLNEANRIAETLRENIRREQQNKQADAQNRRALMDRIQTLRQRIRDAEEVKRKQGIYPANFEQDKADLEKTIAQYEELYGPLK